MKINRRDFLSSLSMSTGYLIFGNPLTACSDTGLSHDPYQIVKLGNSGLKTTLLGFGTGVHGYKRKSFLTRQDRSQSLALLQYAYDQGIRYIDTADSYGTHQLIGESFLHIPRDKITLASKLWVNDDPGIPESDRGDSDILIDRFRKDLNTDYIDLVQLHCQIKKDWPDNHKRQMDILENLKSKGIIRAHGVTVHSLEAMQTACESPWVDVIHVRINPYGIAMDTPDPEQVVSAIHKLHNSGKGVIGMKLIGIGAFKNDSEKIDNSIRFVLGLGSVDMVVIGFEEPEEIDNYAQRIKNALVQIRKS